MEGTQAFALLAAVVLLGGGVSAWTPVLVGGAAPLAARLAFVRGDVDGDVALHAPTGALLLKPAPPRIEVAAQALTLRIVTVVRENVDNPLAGDIKVKLEGSDERVEVRDAHAIVTSASPTMYLFIDDAEEGSGFVLPLGRVRGNPFRPSSEPNAVAFGTAGMSYAMEHEVGTPAFGVADGRGSGPFRAALGLVGVRGHVLAVVDDGDFDIVGATETLHVKTGEWRTDETRVAGWAPRYRTERSFAVLEFHDADLQVDGLHGDASFLTRQPTYLVDGALRFRDAAGPYDLNRTAGVGRRTFEAVGSFRVVPQAAEAAPEGLVPSADREPAVTLHVAGDADALRVDGVAIASLPPDGVRAASLLALLAAALLAAWATAKKSLLLAVFPLYTRLTRATLLHNRRRAAIYELIEARPFLHLRELQRLTGLRVSTVAYHAAVLEKQGFVRTSRRAGREHFYAARGRFGPAAMDQLALLASPVRQRIARAILRGDAVVQHDLQALLGLRQSRLSKELGRMVRAGLLTQHGHRNRRYAATPLLAAWLGQTEAPARPAAQEVPLPALAAPASTA